MSTGRLVGRSEKEIIFRLGLCTQVCTTWKCSICTPKIVRVIYANFICLARHTLEWYSTTAKAHQAPCSSSYPTLIQYSPGHVTTATSTDEQQPTQRFGSRLIDSRFIIICIDGICTSKEIQSFVHMLLLGRSLVSAKVCQSSDNTSEWGLAEITLPI